MIDNNVQTTIGSPIEWYKLEIMRDIVSLKDAWEGYSKAGSSGFPLDLGTIRARTQSLIYSLYGYLMKKWKPVDMNKIKQQLFIDPFINEVDLREIFFSIQIQLEQDNITRIDTRRAYDGTRVELENKVFET